MIAMGEQIIKAVRVAEFLKKIILDLHISLDIVSLKFLDTYKPLYEGLSKVTAES